MNKKRINQKITVSFLILVLFMFLSYFSLFPPIVGFLNINHDIDLSNTDNNSIYTKPILDYIKYFNAEDVEGVASVFYSGHPINQQPDMLRTVIFDMYDLETKLVDIQIISADNADEVQVSSTQDTVNHNELSFPPVRVTTLHTLKLEDGVYKIFSSSIQSEEEIQE